MKLNLATLALCVLGFVAPAFAAVETGKPAKDFTLKDTSGKEVSLADYKGKFVVLEWYNPDCPFVKKHYDSANMQKLQAEYTKKGVVWLSINSSAPGKQGYYSPTEYSKIAEAKKTAPTALLLDHDGKVGRLYNAKTTPEIFIINPEGTLIYQGGIDNKPSTDQADIATATNYVRITLDAAETGKPVPVGTTKPYGCSVKY
ncbi:MAG TPA: thioredoxin family protein [Chthoniobacterales bacterium]